LTAVSRLAWAIALGAISCTVGAGISRAGSAAPRSCWSGYSYAGVQNPGAAYGVAGTLGMLGVPNVRSGHVAAWIGVGGAGLGPGGSDVWLQAGIARDEGGAARLYYEVKRPADANATYVQLATVRPGETHKISVLERRSQRNGWRVWIDDAVASPTFRLPRSHGAFQPVATAESWDGGQSVCNGYSFRFGHLAVAAEPGGGWQPMRLARVLRDPAYHLSIQGTGFTAFSR
jgi:hypothetical protein